MASPAFFNDPFDCSLNFMLKELTESEIDSLRKNIFPSNKTERFRKILNQETPEILKSTFENSAKQTLKKLKEQFLLSNGVCCFSETNQDLLMWGHYSDSFKGFCLEFRTDFELFKKLHKVTYSESLPVINTYELLVNENNNFITDLFCTKSVKWAYEKEWRILHNNVGTQYHYEQECLKAIYLGPKIDNAFSEILCIILFCQNPNVEIWKGKLAENEIEIEFDKIIYTPYIIEKQLGLK